MSDVPELITIEEACEDIGGKKKPCHPSTYYRGVRNKIYPGPARSESEYFSCCSACACCRDPRPH